MEGRNSSDRSGGVVHSAIPLLGVLGNTGWPDYHGLWPRIPVIKGDMFQYDGYLWCGNNIYGLGDDYFKQVKSNYLVIGQYSRLNNIYRLDTVEWYRKVIATFGIGDWRYGVYKITIP